MALREQIDVFDPPHRNGYSIARRTQQETDVNPLRGCTKRFR